MAIALATLSLPLIFIIAACVEGWKIALTEKLHEDAEIYANNLYKELIRKTRYSIIIKQEIIDETGGIKS